MSIRNKKRKNNDTDTILNSSYLDDVIENPYITCHEVYNFKKKYNTTEPIILKLVGKYLGLVNNDLKSFWGARYLGISEKDQELDLTFENNQEEIVFGLSIKSFFDGGYFKENDLRLKLLLKYKSQLNSFEVGKSVPAALQDMARILNIKETGFFESTTILFSEPHRLNWTREFEGKNGHKYLFLENNEHEFYKELERVLPSIIEYKS